MGCHAFLQGIFLTHRSNPCLLCLLHWQADSTTVPPGKPWGERLPIFLSLRFEDGLSFWVRLGVCITCWGPTLLAHCLDMAQTIPVLSSLGQVGPREWLGLVV